MKEFYNKYLTSNIKFDKLSFIGILSFIIAFSGFFGFFYEYIFYFFNSGMKEFYWRGSNFLPWINIYATGAVMIIILTYRFRRSPWLVFLITILSTGILEYFSGYFMYQISGIRCWDYNKEILSFFSIDGFVCLRSVLVFGLSGLFLIYFILPFCFYIFKNYNSKKLFVICFFVCLLFLCDEFYNLVITRLFSLPRASTIYKSIGIPYMNYFY